MESINDEIRFWTAKSRTSKTDAGLVAFGVSSGLRLAKGNHMREQIEKLRDELFALCEQTEDIPVQTEFDRGRVYEAKGIRRAMGEVFRDAIKMLDLKA